MTQEEIIGLKKFCIEQAAKVSNDGDELAKTSAYLLKWITEKDNNHSIKENDVVPYPDFLRKEEGNIATSSVRLETGRSSEG